ncbi:MAG: hypothetical protein WB689_34770 [Xanthobacteraceae bacterium]
MKSANGSSDISKSSEMDRREYIGELTSAKETFRQVENGDGEMEAHSIGTLVHRLSEVSRREIECINHSLARLDWFASQILAIIHFGQIEPNKKPRSQSSANYGLDQRRTQTTASPSIIPAPQFHQQSHGLEVPTH